MSGGMPNVSLDEMVDLMARAEGLGGAIPDGVVTEEWTPPFTPKQLPFYQSKARFCLAYGERYSGKTWVGGHKIVKHCWEHWNAHAVVIVGVRRQAVTGGIWHMLLTEILPDWQLNQPGFESTDQKMDTATKDLFVWVRNKFGGYSQIQLVSIPYGANMADRVRGIAASMFYVDELTTLDNPAYFDALIQQIGRRPHISPDDQQYVATTNPDGPSHWTYNRFFTLPRRADGTWDPRYATIHVPIDANPSPTAQSYYQNVLEGTRNDPIEYARLIEGKWVDRPSGESIFARYWVPEIHVRGNLAENKLLLPKAGLPITIGYDLGDSNHGIVFMQQRSTAEKTIWVVFDELVYTDDNVSFLILVPELMQRMSYWCDVCNYSFAFMHVSDKSAFDRFRATTGSYDHRQVEELSRLELEKNKARYPKITRPIRLDACPKPPGSVAARIKVLVGMLQQEEIFFSALCTSTIEAVQYLESEKGEPFSPRRSKHLHPYDALTYPLYLTSLGGAAVAQSNPTHEPQLLRFGG